MTVRRPAPKGAGALPLETGQLADENAHNVLDDVFGLLAEAGVAGQPPEDERAVKVVEPLPDRFVRGGAQSLQQAGGRFHEGSSLGGKSAGGRDLSYYNN